MNWRTDQQGAQAFLAIRIGDRPLVPIEVQERGTPREIIAAGLEALAELRRRRSTPDRRDGTPVGLPRGARGGGP